MVQAGPDSDSPGAAAARLLEVISERFGAGLKGVRPAQAIGASPDADALRRAYLSLLKLTLCDLAGTTTSSVARTWDGRVMSRELAGEDLRLRAAGMDWPLHGLTMVGLARLDDLQERVEAVVADEVPGDLIEAGSWRGGASLLMRATLDSLEGPGREVFVADSFQGFPEVDGERTAGYDLPTDLAGVDFLAVSQEEVAQTFARLGVDRDVTFVPGFFQDTLPGLAGRRWAIVRLDGDTYESTRVALEALYPGLSVGGYLIVDDYVMLGECRAAVDDFRAAHRIIEPIEQIDWCAVRWRRESEPDAAATTARPGVQAPKRTSPKPVERHPRARVPSVHELEVRHELNALKEQLAEAEARLRDAEAQVRRLEGSPLIGPTRWLRTAIKRRRGVAR